MNDVTFLGFNETGAVTYNTGQTVIRVSNCNGFLAVNTGDDTVFVNDQILYPGVIGSVLGDSFRDFGNFGEIFLGNITIRFAGIGANPSVTINQKFYVSNKLQTVKFQILNK